MMKAMGMQFFSLLLAQEISIDWSTNYLATCTSFPIVTYLIYYIDGLTTIITAYIEL